MAKPKAFEVEDLLTRKNFVFVYEPKSKTVSTYDTSIRQPRKLIATYREHKGSLISTYENSNSNPFDFTKAKDYFNHLYEKSLKFIDKICFIG